MSVWKQFLASAGEHTLFELCNFFRQRVTRESSTLAKLQMQVLGTFLEKKSFIDYIPWIVRIWNAMETDFHRFIISIRPAYSLIRYLNYMYLR